MSSEKAHLVCLSFSPWTEKARWGLDFLKYPYRHSEHSLVVEMPWLSLKSKRPMSEITIPIFFDQGESIMDSFEIVRHADRDKHLLMPLQFYSEIRHANEIAEVALDAGRALCMYRVAHRRDLQIKSFPVSVPSFLQPLAAGGVRLGLRYLAKSFPTANDSYEQSLKRTRDSLRELKAIWEKRSGPYVFGTSFTYGDIVIANSLHTVLPPAAEYHRMPDALREAWVTHELIDEFQGMLTWRDDLYRQWRRNAG